MPLKSMKWNILRYTPKFRPVLLLGNFFLHFLFLNEICWSGKIFLNKPFNGTFTVALRSAIIAFINLKLSSWGNNCYGFAVIMASEIPNIHFWMHIASTNEMCLQRALKSYRLKISSLLAITLKKLALGIHPLRQDQVHWLIPEAPPKRKNANEDEAISITALVRVRDFFHLKICSCIVVDG